MYRSGKWALGLGAGKTSSPLRLLASDVEDLELVSAAVQDGLVTMSALEVDKRGRTVTFPLVRFRWERAVRGGGRERVGSALQVAGMVSLRAAGVRRDDDTPRPILCVKFSPDDTPPGGSVALIFGGGGHVDIGVECLDVALADVSHPWPTRARPDHMKGLDE